MNKKHATAVSWPIKPMPTAQKELPLDGMFSEEEFAKIQVGLIPKRPLDKWFIYLEREWLHFHRSSSGTSIFRLRIVPFEDRYHANLAIVNREPSQYRNKDDKYDVALIGYLIDHLLLGRFAPMPTPKGLRQQDQARYKQDMMGKKQKTGRIDLGRVSSRSHNGRSANGGSSSKGHSK